MIDGALLLDKPVDISSNRALQEAKKAFGASKAGHAGTLDPLASGLLLVLFGEATKLAGALLEDDKEYEATLKLGEKTSTGDAEGEVLERGHARVSGAEVDAALARFLGAIDQVPPMHSALKREGVPLYALARRGQTVERAPRRVHIRALEALGMQPPYLRLRVRCSKGTYVRTLAEDIGTALGTCAHLASLRRTASGRFTVAQATRLDALSGMPHAERLRALHPLADLLADLPRAELSAEEEVRFRNGQSLARSSDAAVIGVFGRDGGPIGLGTAGPGGELRPLRLFARPQGADIHRKTL